MGSTLKRIIVGCLELAVLRIVPLTVYFVGAIIVSALIFGLGHLPFVFALVPEASVALIVYVIVGNFIFGLIAGYLYWKKGLESAIIAHMFAHVVMLTAIFFGV